MKEEIKYNIMLSSIVILSLIAGSLLMYAFDNHRMNEYAQDVSQTVYKVQNDCKNAYLQDIKINEGVDKFVITFEK